MFCYADEGQVGDSAHGREIRSLLCVAGLCRAHLQSIIHAEGMSSGTDRYLLSERRRYDSDKERGENGKTFSIHFIGKAASNKVSSTDVECKAILESCGNLFL